MPASSNEWTELATAAGFERCVRGSLRELYGYAGLLVGRDRGEAERQVTEVYRSLFRVSQAGRIDSVSLGALRSAARELWLDRSRIAILAQASEAGSFEQVATLGDLSEVERAVVVLRHVNRMPLERVADELGLDLDRTRAIESRAITRLRGVDDASGRWLRGFYGDVVVPAPGLVDRIIDGLGSAATGAALAGAGSPAAATPAADVTRASAPTDASEVGADAGDGVQLTPDEAGHADHADHADHDGDGDGDGDAGVAGSEEDPLESLRPDPVRYRRSRWPLALSTVLVLALIGALVLWLDGDDDDDAAAPSSTPVPTAPATTIVVPTTAAITTAPATTAPPTTEPGPGQFVPACAARPAIGEPAETDESALETFGPLGSTPNLSIDLPEWVEGDAGGAQARVVRVTDSLLISVFPVASPTPQSVVARIALDGTVLWVQCLDGAIEAVPIPDRDGSAVAVRTGAGWSAMSLTDGAIGDALDPGVAEDVEASLAAPDPDPESAYIGFAEDDQVIAGYDADGTRLWSDPNAHPVPGEGFRTATTDGIGVASICPDPSSDPDCEGGELRGYVPRTGVVRWKLEGTRQVAAVADGYALVSDPVAGWVLLDVSSGSPVDGQTWADPATFEYRCCGEGELWYVDRQGGVVVVSKPGSLAIWYPAAAELGAADVTLP